MAQFERETIEGRIKGALRYRKENGKKYFRVAPYGYFEQNGFLHENPQEKQTLQEIANLKGTLTSRQMAEFFNQQGKRTR